MSSFWTYFIVQVPVGCLGRDDLYAAGKIDVELTQQSSELEIEIGDLIHSGTNVSNL